MYEYTSKFGKQTVGTLFRKGSYVFAVSYVTAVLYRNGKFPVPVRINAELGNDSLRA